MAAAAAPHKGRHLRRGAPGPQGTQRSPQAPAPEQHPAGARAAPGARGPRGGPRRAPRKPDSCRVVAVAAAAAAPESWNS